MNIICLLGVHDYEFVKCIPNPNFNKTENVALHSGEVVLRMKKYWYPKSIEHLEKCSYCGKEKIKPNTGYEPMSPAEALSQR